VGIGSISLTDSNTNSGSAVPVRHTSNGTGGSPVTVTNGTTFVSSPINPGTPLGGTDSGSFDNTEIGLLIDSGLVSIYDGDATGSATKLGIANFANVYLEHAGLIAPTALDFHVGIGSPR
jgi:hypothetical protein